jgi:tRNA dimethylallyltransferase
MQKVTFNLIVILGPTASGKTKLAARLARDRGSEIISADSRQVYRGMDIGTGKDFGEYVVGGLAVPCHLIDIVDPDYEFSVFDYQVNFSRVFTDISSRGEVPIMVGGTGLYIEAAIKGYRLLEVPENPSLRHELEKEGMQELRNRLIELKPTVHNTTDLLDRRRLVRAIEIMEFTRVHNYDESHFPSIVPLAVGIRWERCVLRQRITDRLNARLEAGMIEEVERLYQSGIGWDKLDFFGLEYRYVGLYLRGVMSYREMFQKLNTRIHQFAKKQETWFRRMEKKGTTIHWINSDDHYKAAEIINGLMK